MPRNRGGGVKSKTVRVLSLGAGVQSSTLLLLACAGELERPDVAIFADTGWQSRATYAYLEYLRGRAAAAGIPVLVTSGGNLREDLLCEARGAGSGKVGRIGQPPFFVHNATPGVRMAVRDTLWGIETTEATGPDKVGRLRRKCTKEYKLDPVRRAGRAYMQAQGARRIEQWIGISLDEIGRMKPSGVRYVTNRWPLIERRWTRADCEAWLGEAGHPIPPKSSCLGCPFHSDAEWRRIRDESPEEWADTVAVDAAIRHGIPGVQGAAYMHRSCRPLGDVELGGAADDGQLTLWEAECEGVCGV